MTTERKPMLSEAHYAHAARYSRLARALHWLMAIGFVLMWLTGVLVTNIEGVPFFTENDRQGVIRDLHKSIGLTLLGLLILRAGLRFIYPAPALPAEIPVNERKRAHLGHVAIYVIIIAACISGYAIADLHEYSNAYFGIALPQIFPTTERVLGWWSTPWAYVLHAILAYGMLALVIGHVLFVLLHRRRHGVQLLTRMLHLSNEAADRILPRLVRTTLLLGAITILLATIAFVTLGPTEEARDYLSTTPISQRPAGQQ
jgi:cytochrome b561